MKTLNLLTTKLIQSDKEYYENDNSDISDAEYDSCTKEYFDTTGKVWESLGKSVAKFEKVKHVFPVLSLAKTNTMEDLRLQLTRLAPGVITPKYDGLTVVREKGLYVSRGDGLVGENISHNAKRVFTQVRENEDTPVRSEVYLKKSVFKEINEELEVQGKQKFKNMRNAAAGILRNLAVSPFANRLSYTSYDMIGLEDTPYMDMLNLLDTLGYNTPDREHTFYFSKMGIDKAIDFVKNFNRDDLDYEIDGLVIRCNLKDSSIRFGTTDHHPKNSIAYKFPSQGKWTTLKDVLWQTGRTGKVTPVAILEPVNILNTTVSRATLHNVAIMESLNLSIGCEVFVTKANDVIPQVEKSRNYDELFTVPIPDICPNCGNALTDGLCTNELCTEKLALAVVRLARKEALDIEGLSIETARKMVSAGLVVNPEDVFRLAPSDILSLEGFAEPSTVKLYKLIQNAKTPKLSNFINAMGVLRVGKKVSRDLANYFKTYDNFIDDAKNGANLARDCIEGIGLEIQVSISRNWEVWENLREFVTPQDVKDTPKVVANQLTFVITGKLSKPRKYFEDLLISKGHKVSNSISGKTSYLLAGEDCGSKIEKAEKYKVQIISEEQLTSLL